ncbi:MAG: ankyrin repeat domain-containing protein [Burkholderiales bacterium]|nr:ankyrin repeat domain-containing protein [Burkholderiales bacterium]
MYASRTGREAVVALLLKEGAREKINERDDRGMTALMLARKEGHEEVVALLLKEGAE